MDWDALTPCRMVLLCLTLLVSIMPENYFNPFFTSCHDVPCEKNCMSIRTHLCIPILNTIKPCVTFFTSCKFKSQLRNPRNIFRLLAIWIKWYTFQLDVSTGTHCVTTREVFPTICVLHFNEQALLGQF